MFDYFKITKNTDQIFLDKSCSKLPPENEIFFLNNKSSHLRVLENMFQSIFLIFLFKY